MTNEKAIGIALESFRLDIVEESIKKGDAVALLSYVLDAGMTIIQHLEFRNKVRSLYCGMLIEKDPATFSSDL